MPSEDQVKLLYPDDVGKICDHRSLVSESEFIKTFSAGQNGRATIVHGLVAKVIYDVGFLLTSADNIAIELKEVSGELESSISSNADSLAR